MSREITLRQLRYFVGAAETGQFSLAATRAHISQSAITTAVQSLEDALGVKLFERQPQGVTLTAEGHSFYQHARHVLDSLQDAVREPRFRMHGLSGVVPFAATYTVLGYFLPPLLARFRMSYPDVRFDLCDCGREEIEEGIESGRFQLGVVVLSNITDPGRFCNHVLIRSRRQLWLSSTHPLLNIPFPTLEDIAPYPYIQATVDEGETSTRRYWHTRGLQPKIELRTGSMEALRGLVAHGFGVTILSDMVYRPWSLEGRKIEVRPINDAIPHMEVGLIWKKGEQLTETADALRQFLIQACGS